MESTVLHNVAPDELKTLISDAITEKLNTLKPDPKESYLTRKQVATMLHISLTNLHELTMHGKIPAYRLGGRVLFLESDIMKALKLIRVK
jgi:excisionase family DNA binding protein